MATTIIEPARDEVKPRTPSPARRDATFGVRAVGDDAKRTLRFIGTDETPDRYNTIFRVDGWDFTNYRKNPVFLFHHNQDGAVNSLPIGRTVNIELVEETAGDGRRYRAWAFDVEFAPKDLNPFADVVYRMYKEGYLHAVSVGFIVRQRREVVDEAELKSLGLTYGRYGEVFERTELSELSAVPVPGNPNAIISGLRAMLPEALRDVVPLEPDAEEKEEIDARWLADRLRLIREVLTADATALVVEQIDPPPPVAVTVDQSVLAPRAAADAVVPPASTTDSTVGAVVPSATAAPSVPPPSEEYIKLLDAAFATRAAEQMKLFEELTREVRSLRAAFESRVGSQSDPSEVAVKPAPVVREDKDESRAQAVDPLEAVLAENLDALRNCRAAWRK